MQVARPHLEARHDAERLGDVVADGLERLAPAFAREREERVKREEVARLNRGEQRVEARSHIVAARKRGRLANFDDAHVDLFGERLLVIGSRLAFAKNIEHNGLRRRDIGLVEGAHLHEVTAHGDGVLPT